MNTKPDKSDPAPHNLFGVLLAVFAVLALDSGFHLFDLIQQRGQLDQARLAQAQNFGQLAQGRQAHARLEPLCLDLLQIATTNAAAKRIVQEFNIQGGPKPVPAPPAISPTNTLLSAPSNAAPVSSNPPAAP